MMHFLRLIRFPNLIIVALTQCLIYYLVFINNYQAFALDTALNTIQFFLLVISTLCIAAGGYIINDILDYDIDVINKPDQLIVGKQISIKAAKRLYLWSILLGFIISVYLAVVTQNLPLLFLYPTAVLLLYLYSKYFKKSFLVGNLIVSFFCAFVAGIVWVAERNSFLELQNITSIEAIYLTMILIFYLLFAFISTLFREIIKDIEDIEGDRIGNCHTLPIVLGIPKAKIISTLAAISLIAVLAYLLHQLWLTSNYIAIIFSFLAIFFPIFYALYKLYYAEHSKDFHYISQIAKLIMLMGLILLFLIA